MEHQQHFPAPWPGARFEVKSRDGGGQEDTAPSFRRARRTRRRKRAENLLNKSMDRSGPRIRKIDFDAPAAGPTEETVRKLTPDPLKYYEEKKILTVHQVRAAHAIRRAYQLITLDTGPRVSTFEQFISRRTPTGPAHETDHEIHLKDRYAGWVDRMSDERLMVGPVLDMVVEEMSLAATDRKWRHRKGWARDHLREALDIYLEGARRCG